MSTSAVRRFVHPALTVFAVLVAGVAAPSTAAAATYYVATTGNDSNSCSAAQSINTPKRTISGASGGISCLSPGDMLLIRGGTYPGFQYSGSSFPSGTSWSAPVTIAGYQSEIVTITVGINVSAKQYVIFDKLVIDATAGNEGFRIADGSHHIRLSNSEVKNSKQAGILIPRGNVTNNEFINVRVHGSGGHGFYISGSYNLIDGCVIYSNGGFSVTGVTNHFGIQVYNGYSGESANYNVIRNNRIYAHTIDPTDGGIIVYGAASDTVVYNNLIYGNINGITVGGSAPHRTKILNNTIYNNRGHGVQIQSGTGQLVANNILNLNGTNLSLLVAVSNSSNLTIDPRFVNPAGSDFALQSGSPAIDAGLVLAEVTIDIMRTPRPQGDRHDIGAFEYMHSAIPPAIPTNLRILSSSQ